MGTIASGWWMVALLFGDADPAANRDGGSEPHSGWALTCASATGAQEPVTTLREFAALALAPGETLEPQIAAPGLHARWAADLKVARAGRYRFTIESCGGTAELIVARQSSAKLPHCDSKLDAVTIGDWLDLAAGTVPLLVDFRRAGDAPARLRTLWEMAPEGQQGFGPEPIPQSVVSVPAELRAAVDRESSAERGRVALVELGCVNCHAASGGAVAQLERRSPIALARVAVRARTGWLARWLDDPQKLKPGCGMPGLLSGPDAQRDAAALVELFVGLASTTDSKEAPAAGADRPVDPLLVERGRALYHEVGCVACHEPFDSPQAAFTEPAFSNELPKSPPAVPLGDLSRKWRVDELAKFLVDPTSIRTHGRMPDFGLGDADAKAIADYLASKFIAGPAGGVAAGDVPSASSAERVEAGKKVFNERGCAACHTLGEGMGFQVPEKTKPLAALDAARGCLADANGAAQVGVPHYVLGDTQRDDLRAALATVARLVAAPAPAESSRRIVAAFQCLRCHEKDGHGGVSAELAPYFRTLAEADLGDEGHLPPRLTGVGARLRSEWIEEVVAKGTRARPYLAAHMPKFGADLAKRVANGVAALEGVWRSDSEAGRACEPKFDPSLAAAGRALVGKEGLNCITCHSFGDRPSAGTPGLDFQMMAKRIRGDFWRRYALAPLRFKPGTRMPVFFTNGKSEADILDHDAARQIEAIWSWFEREKEMPAPDGVPSGQRFVLDVGDRPRVFRTFLQRAGNRGIAVGTPQGLHFAFDAEQIRLVEAWTGEFLDVAPVWEGRGGHVAPEMGSVVWSATPGPALLLAPPGAMKQAIVDSDHALNAQSWPLDSGRNHGVRFRGYRLENDGRPTFLYDLGDGVHVEERDQPTGSDGIRFTRDFVVRGLKSDQLVMMRQPADATSGVMVANGELIIPEARTAAADSPSLLFFRSDGAPEGMTLRYGVRQ